MDYQLVLVFALVVILYSAFSGAIGQTVVGGAITFTVLGLLLGPSGFNLLQLSIDTAAISTLAQLTLALLLFVDAANLNLRELIRTEAIPIRLLLIGLPLTILLGFLVGIPLFGSLSLVGIALVATMLAPTDAALGEAVVSDKNVPDRIRTSLTFESGLNDGICVPIFLTLAAFAVQAGGDKSLTEIALTLIVKEVGIGLLAGAVIAAICAALIVAPGARAWIAEPWQQNLVPAIALACFAAAQSMGGSGFIASFVGGLVFGSIVKDKKQDLLLSADSAGQVLTLLTWVVFGATIVSDVAHKASWEMVLYAFLSLTVVRMLPVWLVLRGTGLRNDEVLFIGWFGPRGLASIVFSIMAIDAGVPGAHEIAIVVACTVILSILAHGLSAKPLAQLLASRLAQAGQKSDA